MTRATSRLSRPRRGPHTRDVACLGAGGLALLFAFTTLSVAASHTPRAKGLDVGVVGFVSQARSALLGELYGPHVRKAPGLRRVPAAA